jgi:hypothetical protein
LFIPALVLDQKLKCSAWQKTGFHALEVLLGAVRQSLYLTFRLLHFATRRSKREVLYDGLVHFGGVGQNGGRKI